MEILAYLIAVGVIAYLAHKRAKADAETRERAFEATMRSLEEKAKRAGTFKVSYFDKPTITTKTSKKKTSSQKSRRSSSSSSAQSSNSDTFLFDSGSYSGGDYGGDSGSCGGDSGGGDGGGCGGD